MTTSDIGSATPPVPARIRISQIAGARPDIGVATDVGLRHPTNQDFAAVDVDRDGCHVVLVVADGVSSTDGAEEAAQTAASTACDYLTAALTQGLPVSDDAVISLFGRAVQRAHQAVLDAPGPEGTGACTLVTAICSVDRILVANVGDTRAYWFPTEGPARRLTVDDSVAQAQIDMGMSREEAEAGAGAHAITKWIGARATDLDPRVLSIRPRTPGWVMVCSDGLWNHVPDPTALGEVVGRFTADAAPGADGRPDPQAVAAALAEFANSQGGFDNVTVALWRADAVPVRREDSPASPDAPVE
ncbi:PP2C family protein-serine/threonine phosphatase [Acidipropionibacterium virtanenii]|uniref:Serine/threonine phosphatase stp n=1 Tax=Acidipropionibacterium virtanenii TaxID=2057246 RepID=A0A344UTN7_9ACTN|nr:protein phosphatase 2C domain-containing protein [Acidipropionibacterium virtanenii]AXE38635.1 Serine/threonine phosphatase stp [Acidipropionibacterium virtanenii]